MGTARPNDLEQALKDSEFVEARRADLSKFAEGQCAYTNRQMRTMIEIIDRVMAQKLTLQAECDLLRERYLALMQGVMERSNARNPS